jgi:hypothetical protein
VKARFTTAASLTLALVLAAAPALAWDDATGDRDMPWLGRGERARLFTKKSTCIMCPTGYSFHQSWGTSGRSGDEPYSTVSSAMRFLKEGGVLDKWPEAIGEGSVGDGREIIDPRAVPYRFIVVMLEPTVIVMRFDLGAMIKVGESDPDQAIGTPWLNQSVDYGTRFPATGSLMWFSPDAKQTPTAVTMVTPERGEIVVKGKRLVLERRGDEWLVAQPVSAK